uniref:Protein spinster homolog 2-like n=1 Tax=Saccoglossus kowalevskii TaxID=10224 RepID=A0ABM0MZH2_SACKO|nr:PREDICTED: protein spinster homolog 2-like [Saccoglossus kowalevskii]
MGQLIGKVFKQTYYEEDDEIPTSESQTSTLRALSSLFILFIVYILNQADRQLLPAVIPAGLACASENESQSCEPDWNTSDWMFSPHCDPNDCIKINTIQHGVLTGAAFVLSYTISGIPIGRIADLSSRTKVLGIGMFFWSAMVLLTGLAKDYWLILLARVGVGIGQASCNPTSYAMISDFFYVNRAKALAFYHSGLYIGSAIGYAAAAANDVICWRWPFFILAFLGFLTVMLVVLFIRDPQPEERILPEPVPNSLKETVHQLFKSKPFLVICLASSVRQIAGYALASWLSTYYARRYHIQPFKYNGTLALIVLFGGGFGTLLGGVTADR